MVDPKSIPADDPKRIKRLILETDIAERAIREGARRALLRHKKLGEAIAVWKDGKVAIIPPDQIEVSETPIEF